MLLIYGASTIEKKIDINSILNFIQQLSISNDITIQVFDGRFVYGSEHLQTACEHAVRAFKNGTANSGNLAIEILLYAAGEYQIKNALSKLGLKEDSSGIVILFYSDNDFSKDLVEGMFTDFCKKFELKPDNKILEADKHTLREFGILLDELDAVPEEQWLELVLEKVALVDIKK